MVGDTSRGYGSAAPLYLSAGWVGVLPLPRGRKLPPPPGHTGRDGADPTRARVRAWVRRCPGGNLALRLPAIVVGLDLDLYKPAGAASYTSLVDQLGPLPPTWRSSARRDGVSGIRLFRVPPGVDWAERQAGQGIELIHHHHRYAVVWPSAHPHGRTYQWWSPTGEQADRVPHIDELPWLPPAWIGRLSGPPMSRPATVDTHPQAGTRPIGTGYPAAALIGAVAELAAMTPGSGRNNALNRKAYHLGGLVGAGQLNHDQVRAQLYRAAAVNGHLAKHGPRQTLATIDSGLRAGAARPRRIP
jgi:hypothetical protein